MILGISGTPGTGKTTLALELASRLSLQYIDVTKFAQVRGLFDQYDPAFDTYYVDPQKIEDALIADLDLTKDHIIDSHMSHLLRCVTHCVVCVCDLPVLKARLSERKYSEQKIRENLDTEIFDTCYIDAVENDIPTLKINTTNKLTESEYTTLLKNLKNLQKEK